MEDYTATIIRYYETCAIDYRLVWHLDTCCAMHFGYWDEHVTRLRYALDRENAILAERAHIRHTEWMLDVALAAAPSIWPKRLAATWLVLPSFRRKYALPWPMRKNMGWRARPTFSQAIIATLGFPAALLM